jgi:hypothetical protein
MPTTADMMKLAFRDELSKIAFLRTGRKPIGVDRLLEREAESETTPSNAFTESKVAPETFKADIEKVSSLGKGLAIAGLGGLATLALQRANRDRAMGRQMRLQAQGQQY